MACVNENLNIKTMGRPPNDVEYQKYRICHYLINWPKWENIIGLIE